MQQKYAEKPSNYFPYTHGDHVERQRVHMRAELKEYQQEIRQNNRDNRDTTYRSTSQFSSSNQIANSQHTLDDSSRGGYRSHTPGLNSNKGGGGETSNFYTQGGNSKTDNLRIKFAKDDSSFLKANKVIPMRKADEF